MATRRVTRQSVDSFIDDDEDEFDDEDREALEMLRSMTKYDPNKYACGATL
jgi:hypothetical protein